MHRSFRFRALAAVVVVGLAIGCAYQVAMMQVEVNRGAYFDFVEMLPVAADEMLNAPRAADSAWIGYVGDFAPISPSREAALKEVLEAPLTDVNGKRIQELKHHKGPTPVAFATCVGTQPAIVYSSHALARMTIYSLPFLREHERAHHTSGHLRCTDPLNPMPPAKPGEEKQADCTAVQQLALRGAKSDILIIVAADRLIASSSPGDHLYPPDVKRSEYILARCA